MHHPHTVHIGKVVFHLTHFSVASDVEFRDRNTEGFEGLDLEWGRGGVFRETVRQVLLPLTTNVIRDDDIGDPGFDFIHKSRCKGIVNVDVPGTEVSLEEGNIEQGYLSPFCRLTTLCRQMNGCRHETATTPVTA